MSVSENADIVSVVRERIRERIDALEPAIVEERMLRIVLAVVEARLPVPAGHPRTRAQQALSVIAAAPGSRPTQVAAEIGVDVTKVYPALRTLEERGFAHCADRRWFLGPSTQVLRTLVRGDGSE